MLLSSKIDRYQATALVAHRSAGQEPMVEAERPAFGVLLRRYRVDAGLTQEELAERAGMSERSVSDLERGLRRTPRPHTVRRLVDALELGDTERSVFVAAARAADPRVPKDSIATPLADAPPLAAADNANIRTFLVADIRGYTRFTQERGDEAAARLATTFASLARASVEARSGQVIELRGDEALAAFSSARQALRAAVELQAHLLEQTDAVPDLPLPVGIGIDAGEAVPVEEGYRGTALNLAARLCNLAGPGEVLASEGVTHLAGKVDGLDYVERGATQLKGFTAPTRVVEVVPELKRDLVAVEPELTEPRLPIGGFLGALPDRELIARHTELQSILAAVEAAAEGSGRLLMLVGEPGVGKTRLAQEVTLEARDRGFLLATGRCYEPDRAVPFYPFLDALAAAFSAVPSALRAEVPRRWPYMQRLLPHPLGAPLPLSSDAQEDQQRLFRAVTGFVQAASLQMPVALMLDDLHWADASSLELLQQLARETRGYRVLLLGTYRDVEVGRGHPLERALRDLMREHLVNIVPVRRLEENGTAALVGATLGDPEVAPGLSSLLHRHTDGNAFFIEEVVRALVERGDIYRRDGTWEWRDSVALDVPPSVRSAVGERLSRLDAHTQEILYTASALGQVFEFHHLRLVAEVSEGALEQALDEALDARLIRETVGDVYTFSHALVQQALYADLSARRRRKLHLAAAEALERLYPGHEHAAELAGHYVKADEPARALPYAMLAGDRAETVFAHAEAEQHYRMSFQLAHTVADRTPGAPGSLPPAESAQLQAQPLEKLGGLLRTVARSDEAVETLERASRLYHAAGDLAGEGRTTALIGWVYHTRGTPHEGIERIRRIRAAIQSALDEDSASESLSQAAASLDLALGMLLCLSGNYGEALTALERAGELARDVGDDRILAQAEATSGTALLFLDRQEDALLASEHAIPLAENAEDEDALFIALDIAAELCMVRGDFQGCKAHRERAVELVERKGDPARTGFELACLGHVLFCLGNWAQARAHFQRAMDLSRQLESSFVAAHSLLRLGMCELAEGDWNAAERHLEKGVTIAEQEENTMVLAVGQGLLSELDLLKGSPEAARGRLELLLDRPNIAESDAVPVLPLLAWAHLELGNDALAGTIVAEALERASTQHNQLALADILRVQGAALARQGRREEAQAAFADGLALTRKLPFPYAEARILCEYGMLLSEIGQVDESIARYDEALTIFRRLGANKDADRVEAARKQLQRSLHHSL